MPRSRARTAISSSRRKFFGAEVDSIRAAGAWVGGHELEQGGVGNLPADILDERGALTNCSKRLV